MTPDPKEPEKKFRPFRFAFKILGTFVFLMYVFMGAQASVTFFKLTFNRRMDISVLPSVIRRSLDSGNPAAVTEWVRLRPLSETGALIKTVTPHAGELEPRLFLEFSQRELRRDEPEESLFWLQAARYRFRYDVLRCDLDSSHETMDRLLEIFFPADLKDLLAEFPELLKPSLRRVLDFDARYPARNKPDFTCALVAKIDRAEGYSLVPAENWEKIRLNLREATESFLREPEKKPVQ